MSSAIVAIAISFHHAVPSRAAPLDARSAAIDRAGSPRDALHRGDFDRFVELALAGPSPGDRDPALERLRVEALLSIGQNESADARAAGALVAKLEAADQAGGSFDEPLLKQWLTARWRQGRALDEPWLERLLDSAPSGEPRSTALAAVGFWRTALAGAAPYRFDGKEAALLPLDSADSTDLANPRTELANAARNRSWPTVTSAIAIDVNRVRLPRAFIDTGAQHTLLTADAAAAAGVEVAGAPLAMTGFAQFSARPGLIRRLDFGGLSLRDVPVVVGDSPTLRRAGGQAALGIDLLSHLRVSLDYPARQLIVARAHRDQTPSAAPVGFDAAPGSTIRLWTFSYAVLAQGRLANDRYARTLIDTGACRGAYVSTSWADAVSGGFSAASGRLISRRQLARRLLADWRIDGSRLTGGNVRGMFPTELDRLDAFDVLIGQEALADRRVEIDLSARRLWLSDVESARSGETGLPKE